MKPSMRRFIARTTALAMIFVQAAQLAQAATTLSTVPLASSTITAVRPNIMYVLDDSGSMAWDFTPDYVNDSESPTAHTWGMCWGTNGTISGSRTGGGISSCQTGNGGSPNDSNVSSCCNSYDDMPWATAAVNYQFYDPAINYVVPVHADGSAYASSTPTAAKSDGFAGTGSTNLTTSWAHQVWCTVSTAAPTAADPTAGGKCLQNQDTSSGTLYPDATHVFLKNYNAAPYYFVMNPAEYCTDTTKTNCVRSASATSVGSVAFNTPVTFRWCSAYDTTTHTFSGCQANRDQSHYIPNYLGGWAQNGSPGSFASASLQVKSVTTGQSINSLTIGGVDAVNAGTFTAGASDTTNSIGAAVCSTIQTNSSGTGYTCSAGPTVAATSLTAAENGKVYVVVTAGTTSWTSLGASANTAGTVFTKTGGNGAGTGTARSYDSVIIKAAAVGTAANGQQVLVSGPAPTTPVNSEGTITVTNPPTSGFQITGVTVNSVNIIATTITSNGNADTTAQSICTAINANSGTSNYRARYGSTTWGTCNATSTTIGALDIQRIPTDSTDNGQSIVVTGPPPATQYTGTITVTSTTGQTRIDDIKVGTASILSSKPLTYSDGTDTAGIATDIASKINSATGTTGCSAAIASNVVTITGSGSCTGTLAYTATPVAATGILRVSTLGNSHSGDLGGIQVSTNSSPSTTANLVGHLTVTDASAVSTNATTIKNAIGSGFTAATPVVNGSSYDITVTAPTGSSYNGQSFAFLAGTAGPGAAGIAPQWTFGITGASADNASISSITCGGTNTIQTNTTTTGAGTSAAVDHINNLAVTSTNHLSGRNDSGNNFAYSCTTATTATPSSVCTITGAAGANASTSLGFRFDCSNGITVSGCSQSSCSSSRQECTVSGAQTNGGSNGTTPTWTFDITNATADNAAISGATCGGTQLMGTTANTGTTSLSSDQITRIDQLARNNGSNDLESADTGNYDITCTTPSTATPKSTCTVTDTSGGVANCTNLTITKDASITIANQSAVSQTCSTSASEWTFDITANANSKNINSIQCAGTNTLSTTLSSSGNGSHATANNWVNDLTGQDGSTGMNNRGTNSYSYSCTTASGGSSTCTVTGPNSASCTTLTFNVDSGITISNASSKSSVCTAASNDATWTFDITGATANNALISAMTCGGQNVISTNTASTGTATASTTTIDRINNLAKNNGANDLQSAINANSYSATCTTASTGTTYSRCTVSGPANTVGACSSFSFTADPSITIANQTQTATGAAATSPAWQFSITGASNDNINLKRVRVGGTSGTPTFNESNTPNTGTSSGGATVYGRINNLTQAASTGLQSIGQNSYSYSCSTASSGTPSSVCTVTGPVGAAACNTTDFVITSAASITTGSKTRTNPGSNPTGVTDDYAPALSTGAAFSGGYAAQGVSVSGLASQTIGTIATSTTTMSNGSASNPLTIPTNATGTSPNVLVLSGGTAPSGANNWVNVGSFRRVDVVSSNNSYSRASTRTDCASATCTYNEELQNFANWYTYYRTRMLSMKTASTNAFTKLDGKYRVGFDNICNATGTSVVRPLAQFQDTGGETSNQRTNWWSSLTSASPNCSTPLRAETAKIGRYYAAKLTSADPMQYSCQQNFMFLVTDGYWNESDSTSIKKVDGADIGNTDNANTVARPYYDGQQSSTSCPSTGSTRSSASSCRTLSDVTYYYYNTDLRDAAFSNATNATSGQDVATNNVPTTDADTNTSQHMSFFAMGLGISGFRNYTADYDTAQSGDYYNIVHGTMDWPAVANLDPTAVDDLWHAAVNGHGKYFSAGNPASASAGLTDALNKMAQRVGAASAAATSNLEPVAGDNFAYAASYTTVEWSGDLQARTIDLTTGTVSNDTNCGVTGSGCQWSARTALDNALFSARRIYVAPISNVSSDPLRLFTYANLTGTEQAYFDPSSLSQYAALHISNAGDITATNLVDYLRGDKSLEQDGNTAHPQIWRKRNHILGDIVDTQPVYMKAPVLSYLDAGYNTFKTTSTAAARKPVVFVSSNDGMLHAFNAHSTSVTVSGATVAPGAEMWAYIPKTSLAAMNTLGDQSYTHRYFVDGSITVGDVNFGANVDDWHTILIGGLGGGGKSYYALDVTDPLNPVYLWEFTSSYMGYTFGNVSINKLPDGTWAAFFTSGYNNADGLGYLYALDPKTGVVKPGYPLITTPSGSAAAQSNLGKISVWATDPSRNNTAEYIYGGDLNGDLWRFDPDPSAAGHTGQSVFKLAHLSNGSQSQPITTKPELTRLDSGVRIVYVGTGAYLGTPDLTNTDVQSVYAIKDTVGGDNLGNGSQDTWNPRSDTITVNSASTPAFLQRKLFTTMDDGSAIANTRMICSGTNSYIDHLTGQCANEDSTLMDWDIYGGWFVDLPETGERMNLDPHLVQGTLYVGTNIPNSTACKIGGDSRITALDYKNGLAVQGTGNAVSYLFSSILVGFTVIILHDASGGTQQKIIGDFADTSRLTSQGQQYLKPFTGKRSLWREFEAY